MEAGSVLISYQFLNGIEEYVQIKHALEQKNLKIIDNILFKPAYTLQCLQAQNSPPFVIVIIGTAAYGLDDYTNNELCAFLEGNKPFVVWKRCEMYGLTQVRRALNSAETFNDLSQL